MYEYKALVTRVVDGDTVDVVIDLGFRIKIAQRVRLLGINAPESRSSSDIEREAGKNVSRILSNTLTDKEVVLKTEKPLNDKYGRFLANIFSEKMTLMSYNEKMVELGLVAPYTGGRMNKWTDEELTAINNIANTLTAL